MNFVPSKYIKTFYSLYKKIVLLKKSKIKNKQKDEYIKNLVFKLEHNISQKQNIFYAKLITKLEKMKKPEEIIPQEKNIVTLKNVTKYYFNKFLAIKVLDNINLEVERGKVIVILGPSGSGKTTLLNLISGLDKPTLGQVIVNEENLINKNITQLTLFRKKNVGFIFQQYGLLPNLTVRENVEIGQNLQENKSLKLNVDEVLKSVGMYEYKNKMPYELSGGQQQRVSIARSVAKNPNILFGDEPTAAVDQGTCKKILELFINVNKKFDTTVFIITHNQEIAKLADIIIKIDNGKLKKIYNTNKKTVKEVNL
jgi:putative ABC transport system ATP-binding protein